MPRRRKFAYRLRHRPAADGRIPAPRPLRLSEEMARLVAEIGERPVRLREVVAILRGRAYTMLLLLLALPFCTPLPLPGLSMPFGVMIALIGFRLSLRQNPWLPQRLLDTSIPPRLFAQVLSASRRLVQGLEFFLRPRWTFLIDGQLSQHAAGAMILVAGLLLLLPLPIPFTNLFPALIVLLAACALLERDGLSFLAAVAVFLATTAVFVAIFWGGAEFVGWLKSHFAGTYQPDYEVAP